MASRRSSVSDPDLVALLNGWASAPSRAAWRMAAADWFADRPDLRGTPVEFHRPPVGFATRAPRRPWGPPPGVRYRGAPRAELIWWLNNVRIDLDLAPPFDHWGRTRIGGVTALVGEPYLATDQLEPVAAKIEVWFGCPVTYDPLGAAHNPRREWQSRAGCVRLAVWHDVPVIINGVEYVRAN